MQLPWWLNLVGLGTSAIAACLMIFFPRMVTVPANGGGGTDVAPPQMDAAKRAAASRRNRLSRLAGVLLFVGFTIQIVAALQPRPPAERAAPEVIVAMPSVPAGCEAAKSAEECADILASAGKNPYAAYGVVGRAPTYIRPRAAPPSAVSTAPAASDGAGLAAAESDAPESAAAPPLSGVLVFPAGYRPFEQFGLTLVYELVRELRKTGKTNWMIVQYRIGAYEPVITATYGADPILQPFASTDVFRVAAFACGVAGTRNVSELGRWSFEFRFVNWDTGAPSSGPFTVRWADCV